MLEGKMFFGLTGIPMRNSVLAKMPLALAEPEPLTVANFTTKSLMPLISGVASCNGVGWVKRSADPTLIVGVPHVLGHPPACAGVDPTYVSANRHCGASDKPWKPARPRT